MFGYEQGHFGHHANEVHFLPQSCRRLLLPLLMRSRGNQTTETLHNHTSFLQIGYFFWVNKGDILQLGVKDRNKKMKSLLYVKLKSYKFTNNDLLVSGQKWNNIFRGGGKANYKSCLGDCRSLESFRKCLFPALLFENGVSEGQWAVCTSVTPIVIAGRCIIWFLVRIST